MTSVNPEVIHAAAFAGHDIYPYATYRPVPEAYYQPTIVPWSFVLHTMGGPTSTSPDALWRYINREDIKGECHISTGYTEIIQQLPFTIRADNNYKVNSWWVDGRLVGAVSVETQDNGWPTLPTTPWNAFQLEHLAGIAAFLNLRYGVPLQRVAEVYGRGVDGHRRFPEWSNVVGKSCPGDRRWTQIDGILVRAQEIVDWQPNTPAPDPGEEDMLAVYPPSEGFRQQNAGYDNGNGPATFVLLASGGIRRATGPDIAYAAAKGLPSFAINSKDHYNQLLQDSGSTLVPRM